MQLMEILQYLLKLHYNSSVPVLVDRLMSIPVFSIIFTKPDKRCCKSILYHRYIREFLNFFSKKSILYGGYIIKTGGINLYLFLIPGTNLMNLYLGSEGGTLLYQPYQ
jgi:hypothetical protein